MEAAALSPVAGAILSQAALSLGAATESPRLDVEILLAHVLDIPRGRLFMCEQERLTADQLATFDELISRRLRGEPVAYITGSWEFWSLPLKVSPDVLIPRPETELLVEWGLQTLTRADCRIADLGTGSGGIALALASECRQASILAVDISEAALAVARKNAKTLQLPNIEMRRADFSEALVVRSEFDLIVSNPPYIAEDDPHLQALQFEPSLALTSGVDGLDCVRRIVRCALAALRPQGWLLIEHGYNQGAAVRALFAAAGFERIETRRDLAGLERVTGGKKS